ncbi:enoyl-CoA hydratase-related protein [Streptomyces sp. NPDC048278]|uniref:enoyl-CoA hydratase-related protein n=1 Tax=Streptomyces sp. NPDC048278 TaxID=3155809 RepID=UPI00341D0C45
MTGWEEGGGVGVRLDGPVAEVTLDDAAHRNGITAALRDALPRALRYVHEETPARAIVLYGRPEIFCSGGTYDDLVVEGPVRTPLAWDFVTAPATCPLPVIAAAQGGAVGGGLLLALYADLTVLSDSSGYAANFMSYGFTPCLGSTYLLPAVFGRQLGTEMLYTARPYRGRELAARGAGPQVVAYDAVPVQARRAADRIARAPREAVELLKRHLAGPRLRAARAAYRRELPGHISTLTSAEARRRLAAGDLAVPPGRKEPT